MADCNVLPGENMSLVNLIIIATAFAAIGNGHGYLKVPLARGGADDDMPSDNVCGGSNEVGALRATYVAGETVEFTIDITIPHSGGYHEFRVCTNLDKANSQSCFDKNRIPKPDGFFRTRDDDTELIAQYILPDDLECEDACVLQWVWVTPDNGDYHGCADIRILAQDLPVEETREEGIDDNDDPELSDDTKRDNNNTVDDGSETTEENYGMIINNPELIVKNPGIDGSNYASEDSAFETEVVSPGDPKSPEETLDITVPEPLDEPKDLVEISDSIQIPGRWPTSWTVAGGFSAQALISLFDVKDFVFDYNNIAMTNEGVGGSSQRVTVNDNPVLITGGMAQTKSVLQPCSTNLPHMHPRATEFIYLVSGSLTAGFIEENAMRRVDNVIHADQSFLIPPGLLHYQRNLGCEPAMYISNFNSEDPGLITLPAHLFQLPTDVVAAAFGRSTEIIEMLKLNLPNGPAGATEECRRRCNL